LDRGSIWPDKDGLNCAFFFCSPGMITVLYPVENTEKTQVEAHVKHKDKYDKQNGFLPPEERRSAGSVLHGILLLLGIGCCVVCIAAGIVGVARGYSVQGMWVIWVFFGGPICVGYGVKSLKRGVMRIGAYSMLYAALSCFMMIGIQGKHYLQGQEHYREGRYAEALEEFAKETEIWYLRLTYNSTEDNAMNMKAKSYCQLGEFDKALETYNVVFERYSGFPRTIAAIAIRDVENGLKQVGEYEAYVRGERDFPYELAEVYGKGKDAQVWILYHVARIYRHDLSCDAKALEVYRRILDMDVQEGLKLKAKSAIEENKRRGGAER